MAEQTVPLSIYLLKPSRVAAFKAAFPDGAGALALAPPLKGYVVPLPSAQHPPGWVDVIASAVLNPKGLSLKAQSPSAFIIVEQGGNTFVLTFGHAWSRLADDWLEADFGRRIALNLVPPDQLVEIHVEQILAKWHIARERSPKAASVREFGVQFDRDLVASVEGVPSNEQFGKKIRGSTSLRVEISFSELRELLDEASVHFQSDAYKKKWPEIDNIKPLTDDNLISSLESQLNLEIKSGEAQKRLVLFTPAYRRAEAWTVDSYVFGRMSKSPATTPYLLISSWMAYLESRGLKPSVAAAKDTPIHLMDESKEPIDRCTAFQCFGYELSLEARQYILSSGIWYEVSANFLNKINGVAGSIPSPKTKLPKWEQPENEGEFNRRCAQQAGFLGFDAKNLMYGGGQSKFEFCDFLHVGSKTLFFAKIASRSSGMSHLVEQVRRTAELFFSVDEGYRNELSKKFKQHHNIVNNGWLKERPKHGEWNLCLVSLGKPAMKLPFFARCGLVKLYNELKSQGHEVSFTAV